MGYMRTTDIYSLKKREKGERKRKASDNLLIGGGDFRLGKTKGGKRGTPECGLYHSAYGRGKRTVVMGEMGEEPVAIGGAEHTAQEKKGKGSQMSRSRSAKKQGDNPGGGNVLAFPEKGNSHQCYEAGRGGEKLWQLPSEGIREGEKHTGPMTSSTKGNEHTVKAYQRECL